MIHQEYISLPTKGHGDMHDLTEQISRIIQKAGIQTGMVNAFNVGSTGAIGAVPSAQRSCANLSQGYSETYPNC